MNEVKDSQTKDSLTESDIKAIEDKLIVQFNSQLIKLAKRATESPPKSVEDIQNINREILQVYTSANNIPQTLASLKALKLD